MIQNKFLKLSQQRVWTGPGEIATVSGGGNRKQRLTPTEQEGRDMGRRTAESTARIARRERFRMAPSFVLCSKFTDDSAHLVVTYLLFFGTGISSNSSVSSNKFPETDKTQRLQAWTTLPFSDCCTHDLFSVNSYNKPCNSHFPSENKLIFCKEAFSMILSF